MKTISWLLITFLLALSLAACQSAATPNPAETIAPVVTEAVTEAPDQETQNLAEEGQPYPPQEAEVQAEPQAQPEGESSSPYPAPGEAENVDWSEAEQIILSGDVLKITQTRDLEIILLLKDHRLVVTTEPVFDEVMRVKEACGDKCSQIILTTEN